jgi:hypothetical protein
MKNQLENLTGTGIQSAVRDGWFDVVKNLPDGEWFKLSDKPSAKVWRKGEYDRSLRGWWANDCDDLSHGKLVKGSRVVFVGFTY